MKTWNRLIADARRNVSLTQADLAASAGLSIDTVKAYEVGRRRPTPAGLNRLLTLLNVDWRTRNEVLMAAGFLQGPLFPGGRTRAERYLSIEEASKAAAQRTWPVLVLNEKLEVLALNDAAFAIVPVDPERLARPVERSLLAMLTDPAIGPRLVNWELGASMMIALFKAHMDRAESLDQPSSYFSAVLDHVCSGYGPLVRRFLDLWNITPGSYPRKVTWGYPIIWNTPEVGELRFNGFVNSVNEVHCIDTDDWIPADEESFRRLDTLLARPELAAAR